MTIGRVGFIGLGTMGAPMARNLLKAGFPVCVYDCRAEAMGPLVAAGATAGASAAAVASEADAVCTMVPDNAEVEAALCGQDGVIAGARAGLLVIEMSTIDPAVTRAMGERLRGAGLRMIDAPVCRSSAHAERGQLEILVGGEAADYEEALPVLRAMGDTFFHVGGLGAGATMKLINNMMGQVIAMAVCEGLALGVKAGLRRADIIEVLSGTAVSNKMLEQVFPGAALKGKFELGFALDWAHKDVGHALRMAARLGSPCPGAAMVHAFQAMAQARGRGRWDHTALITVFEELAGVTLCDRK